MFLNVSGVPQSLKNTFGEYKTVGNKGVVSESVYKDVKLLPKQFKKIKKLDLTGVKKILILRQHALGDVVMLTPLVNYFKSLGIEAKIYASTKYAIKGIDFIVDSFQMHYNDFDLIIDMNRILERDHYEKRYFPVNRVDIYKEYLNIRDIGNNWNAEFSEVDIDVKDAVIGIQLKGSTNAKSMNLAPLLDELEKRDIKFYIIDDSEKYKGVYKNAVVNPTNVVGLLSAFKRLKGVLTFDSGVLWLSHLTNTPAFVIVGPTSGKKITKRHPNNKTTYYDTKLDYGCKYSPHGCGEGGDLCNKKFSCLKGVNYSRLLNNFNDWLESL